MLKEVSLLFILSVLIGLTSFGFTLPDFKSLVNLLTEGSSPNLEFMLFWLNLIFLRSLRLTFPPFLATFAIFLAVLAAFTTLPTTSRPMASPERVHRYLLFGPPRAPLCPNRQNPKEILPKD